MKKGLNKQTSPEVDSPTQRKAADSATVLHNPSVSKGANESDQVPHKWSWHYRQLIDCRERLIKEQHQMGNEAIAEQPHYSMSMADAATSELDRDMLLSEVSHDQALLYEVEEALRRIKDSSYGICQMTGESIPDQRLKAIPWTRFTVEAQTKAEQGGYAEHPHLGKLRSIRLHVRGNLEASANEEDQPEILAADETLTTSDVPHGPYNSST